MLTIVLLYSGDLQYLSVNYGHRTQDEKKREKWEIPPGLWTEANKCVYWKVETCL